MRGQESFAFWRRLWGAIGGALKRAMLGKSAHDYMKQFGGSDAYWERVIAAQQGWPLKQSLSPGPDGARGAGNGALGPRQPAQDSARGFPEPEEEPVHGWTRRQRDDYLARNPAYRPTYEAALQRCYLPATPIPQENSSWQSAVTSPYAGARRRTSYEPSETLCGAGASARAGTQASTSASTTRSSLT